MSEDTRQQPDPRQPNQSGTHRRTIAITCPSCGVRMRVGAQFAGRKGRCKNCGTVLEIPAQDAPERAAESREAVHQTAIPAPPASLSASPGMDAPPTIAAAPPADEAATHTAYSNLPWYRRGGVLTGFTVAAIVTLFLGYGTIPCIPVCIAVLTGDVYYDKRDPDGSLKKWGWSNKVAAIVLLLLNIVPFVMM